MLRSGWSLGLIGNASGKNSENEVELDPEDNLITLCDRFTRQFMAIEITPATFFQSRTLALLDSSQNLLGLAEAFG